MHSSRSALKYVSPAESQLLQERQKRPETQNLSRTKRAEAQREDSKDKDFTEKDQSQSRNLCPQQVLIVLAHQHSPMGSTYTESVREGSEPDFRRWSGVYVHPGDFKSSTDRPREPEAYERYWERFKRLRRYRQERRAVYANGKLMMEEPPGYWQRVRR